MDRSCAFTRKSTYHGDDLPFTEDSFSGVSAELDSQMSSVIGYNGISNYNNNSGMQTRAPWSNQPENTLCAVVNIGRELDAKEIVLIQTVTSILDRSIELVIRKSEGGMKIIIVYNTYLQKCIIQALQELILSISEIYYGSSSSKLFDPVSMPGKQSSLDLSSVTSDQKSVTISPIKSDLSVSFVKIPPISDKSQKTQKSQKSQKSVKLQDDPITSSPTDTLKDIIEEAVETPGVFERPLSLKGQRHVFLFKCRYSQLKAIIDKNGCWGLRMASLEDKWPCLVVYCAKDREMWMNAFRKIQKLERMDFLRKRVSDSMKTVDLKKLEDLTQQYGQKYGI